MLLRCFLVCKTNQLYSLILSLLLWCSEISKTSQHFFAHVAKSFACISVKFWSNSDFSKPPITPHVSCHVPAMSLEHNGSIFDAALVGK